MTGATGKSFMCKSFMSGTKKEPKPKLFGPDIFGWGGGLPRERVGAKKFDTSLETREIKLFGRDIPGFWLGYPRGFPKSLRKKSLGSIFVPYYVPFLLPNYCKEDPCNPMGWGVGPRVDQDQGRKKHGNEK